VRAKRTTNVHMNKIKFEWDKKKDKSNTKKYGITFEEVQTVFFDEHAIQFFDPEHLLLWLAQR